MLLKADLHVHSCLSPCGSLDMSPSRIVDEAVRKGLAILALTDHNSALNCGPFGTLCRKRGILPVFGLEAETREEVHVLCLFAEPGEALELGSYLYGLLPDMPNDPARFGDQVFTDEDENILGEAGKLLVQAADISIDDLERTVHSLGGLFVPAHADRASFSVTSQLGFIPDGRYDALEIMYSPCPPHPGNYPCICGSDAHYPEDLGRRAFTADVREKSFMGLAEAFESGRITLPMLPKRK